MYHKYEFFPPSYQAWKTITAITTYFPVITFYQWISPYYPQGKTSVESCFNLPGKLAWFIMELPTLIIIVYLARTLPGKIGILRLPLVSRIMIYMYFSHYVYRAVISPLILNPSMSPIHLIVVLSAFTFQVLTSTSIGGWLCGYGDNLTVETSSTFYPQLNIRFIIGAVLWLCGFLGNIYHDQHLRDLRAKSSYNSAAMGIPAPTCNDSTSQFFPSSRSTVKSWLLEGVNSKHYSIPCKGLFKHCLYAHYLCEWIEWLGFWIMGGWNCVPARSFFVNEVCTMLPRAVGGKAWYTRRFGKEKIGLKKAVIPGLI